MKNWQSRPQLFIRSSSFFCEHWVHYRRTPAFSISLRGGTRNSSRLK